MPSIRKDRGHVKITRSRSKVKFTSQGHYQNRRSSIKVKVISQDHYQEVTGQGYEEQSCYVEFSPLSTHGRFDLLASFSLSNDTSLRGQPLMIWGAEEIEKKKISEALLQEKINLKRPSPGKNKSQEAISKEK